MARRYTMVERETAAPEKAALGTSGQSTAAIFPYGPIAEGKGEDIDKFTDEGITSWYQANVLNATINDGGHTFGQFNTGYVNPMGWDVKTGAGGLPATKWTPNPVSPGPGSDNPTTMPEAPEVYVNRAPSGGAYGNGGAKVNPGSTSVKIAGSEIGKYEMKNPGEEQYPAGEAG